MDRTSCHGRQIAVDYLGVVSRLIDLQLCIIVDFSGGIATKELYEDFLIMRVYMVKILMPMKVILFVVILLSIPIVNAKQSICYGTTSNGRLERGTALPYEGKNFVSYSLVAKTLGRTYVHSSVKKIILDSYQHLESDMPNKVFKYAETGFEEGGQFKPHKTHRNGLSVDFMVPVINKKGESVHLPTNMLNKYGYAIEFDRVGKYDEVSIDFEAMAGHIVGLHKAAKKLGYDLWRVIFDPKLQPYLLKTIYGSYLERYIQFSKKKSWVRHDEHYHVDFDVPCKN